MLHSMPVRNAYITVL